MHVHHEISKVARLQLNVTAGSVPYTEGIDLEGHHSAPWQLDRNILRVLVSLQEEGSTIRQLEFWRGLRVLHEHGNLPGELRALRVRGRYDDHQKQGIAEDYPDKWQQTLRTRHTFH